MLTLHKNKKTLLNMNSAAPDLYSVDSMDAGKAVDKMTFTLKTTNGKLLRVSFKDELQMQAFADILVAELSREPEEFLVPTTPEAVPVGDGAIGIEEVATVAIVENEENEENDDEEKTVTDSSDGGDSSKASLISSPTASRASSTPSTPYSVWDGTGLTQETSFIHDLNKLTLDSLNDE